MFRIDSRFVNWLTRKWAWFVSRIAHQSIVHSPYSIVQSNTNCHNQVALQHKLKGQYKRRSKTSKVQQFLDVNGMKED